MPTDIEQDTPAWLAKQVRAAESMTPTIPDPTAVGEEILVGEKESFKGDEEKATVKKIKKKGVKPVDEVRSESSNPNGFYDIASELAEMLTSKNRKYGDSYARMAHVLPIFYPDGVPPHSLLDAVFILRIIDKLMRISSNQGDDEEDPVADIAGYAILRMKEMRNS
jgi:hypothetical protein